MEEYIPPEIIRHIASYSSIPRLSRVNKSLYDIENDLLEERKEHLLKKYGDPDNAAKNRDWDSVRFMIEYSIGEYDPDIIANIAAHSGNRSIIQLMLDRGADDYNHIAEQAAEGGIYSSILGV